LNRRTFIAAAAGLLAAPLAAEAQHPAAKVRALLREVEASVKALGIALQIETVPGAEEFEAAFWAFRARHAQAAIIVRNQFMGFHRKTIADLALKHRLPTTSDMGDFAELGGLMSYGFKFADNQRSAAEIVDKILRGAKAGDIPIRQPTTFQLVINLKTAKALGLTIPSSSLLVRADEVIQ
jgi:putative tryptophan/tyrosine transport system substrate-binding protein